jgi:3-deoxy-D-manno-octulosonic-acid transferase
MIKSRCGYTLLLYALLPLVLLRLLWRAQRQRDYLAHIPERFGCYRQLVPAQPLIWLHAVSVGETRAAEPLVRELRQRYPGHRFLLTHMTPTGRATSMALFGDDVMRCYLPYDFPSAVMRFLDYFKPTAGILIETEIWPNLVYACRARAMPLYLVNARLSEKSFAKYRRIAPLVGESLRGFAGIAAQSEDDAMRLTSLGASGVKITGNLKFDIAPAADVIARGKRWRENWSTLSGRTRPVLLAASTREGEETLLLNALRAATVPDLLFVIVPRHPQRFDKVAALLEHAGIKYQRRSANAPVLADTCVVLGDSMGEMAAYYTACDVAFVGGSLLPFGGQNLIEACAIGCPVIIGPHTYNFAEVTRLATAAGAALQVGDAAGVVRVTGELVADRARAQQMTQAAFDFARRHRGATARTLELISW